MNNKDKRYLIFSGIILVFCFWGLGNFVSRLIKYPILVHLLEWYIWVMLAVAIIDIVYVICQIIKIIRKR